MVQSAPWQVERLDWTGRKAYVRRTSVDYYTDAIDYTRLKVLDHFERDRRPEGECAHGEVHVVRRVAGYKKIRYYTHENVGYGNVNLPDQEMHTTAVVVGGRGRRARSRLRLAPRGHRRLSRRRVRAASHRRAAVAVRTARYRPLGRRRRRRMVRNGGSRRPRQRAPPRRSGSRRGGSRPPVPPHRVPVRQLPRRHRHRGTAARHARSGRSARR